MVDSRSMILRSSSILRQQHISTALILCLSDGFIVHNSAPYENIENPKVVTSALLFFFLVINLSIQIFVGFDIAVLANVIHLLMSASHPPLLLMMNPKQMKLFTTSSLFWQMSYSCMVLPLSIITNLVFVRLILRPKARLSLVTKSRSTVISSSRLFCYQDCIIRISEIIFIVFPLMGIPAVKLSRARLILYSP